MKVVKKVGRFKYNSKNWGLGELPTTKKEFYKFLNESFEALFELHYFGPLVDCSLRKGKLYLQTDINEDVFLESELSNFLNRYLDVDWGGDEFNDERKKVASIFRHLATQLEEVNKLASEIYGRWEWPTTQSMNPDVVFFEINGALKAINVQENNGN